MDSPTRSFPEYNSYCRGAVTAWEFLPTVDRTMPFRFIVRDNNPAGGGTSIAAISGRGTGVVVTGPGQVIDGAFVDAVHLAHRALDAGRAVGAGQPFDGVVE